LLKSGSADSSFFNLTNESFSVSPNNKIGSWMSLNLRTTWQGQNVQPFIKEQVVKNRLVNLKASKKTADYYHEN